MSDLSQGKAWTTQQVAAANEIDLLCDEFEAAWVRGETPDIDDCLNRCEESLRSMLLAELLLIDREFRVKRGEDVNRQYYQARYPGYSAVISSLEFSTIDDRVHGSADTIHDYVYPKPGLRIAQFELVDVLGSGASGSVWKARDTRLRRIVALKIPRCDRLSEPERERFLREGRASAQLRHPNIVTVFDVGEDANRVYIVAQYVDGQDLRKLLSERRITVTEAAELAAQLAEALHHAHEQGVVHRDLKPANVLIDREGHPHITDFGLAKWSAETTGMTVDGHIMGTPAYMSPEQARGDIREVDRRTDVYGLAAMLYEMLAGHPPFAGDVASIVHQVVHYEPVRPRKVDRDIPRDLETICLKGMEKDPRRRYPSAQEMAVDLRRYSRGEPILARRQNVLQKIWRLLRRRPAVAALLVLVIVVALAGIAIASLQKQNYRLQGYRPVIVMTEPAGARVAFVPIDPRTGEPNPAPSGIVRPRGTTPLKTLLKPGEYFVEAVLTNELDSPEFAEVYRTVPALGMLSSEQMQRNQDRGDDEELIRITIQIHRTSDVIADMVAIPISEELQQRNPLLPQLIYVDAKETTPSQIQNIGSESIRLPSASADGDLAISLDTAKKLSNSRGKRLPSATEYDAIVKSTSDKKLGDNYTAPANLDGLFGGLAEWTTTTYDAHGVGDSSVIASLRGMRVLKGHGDSELPGLLRWIDGNLIAPSDSSSQMIGFRGARSNAPRFVRP